MANTELTRTNEIEQLQSETQSHVESRSKNKTVDINNNLTDLEDCPLKNNVCDGRSSLKAILSKQKKQNKNIPKEPASTANSHKKADNGSAKNPELLNAMEHMNSGTENDISNYVPDIVGTPLFYNNSVDKTECRDPKEKMAER